MENKTRIGFIAPLLVSTLIFILTALVGVWVAPVQSTAWLRFSMFVVGVLLFGGIVFAAKRNAEATFGFGGLVCTGLAAIIAIHFLLTRTQSDLPTLHKNLTGGVLIMLLPLGLGSLVWAWRKHYQLTAIIALAGLLAGLVGLVASASRGAWLGFVLAVIFTAYFVWRFRTQNRYSLRWVADIVMVGGIGIFLAGLFLKMQIPTFDIVPSLVLGNSAYSRIRLWQDTLALIQDYPFTGSGLGSTHMVYSAYVFLLHVPYLYHAHNLYLQIAVEQGLPGLIAFLMMVFFTIRGLIDVYRRGNCMIRSYSAATFAALVGMLGHGLVEAGLYAHYLLPLVLLPAGLTLALSIGNTIEYPAPPSAAAVKRANRWALWGSLAPTVAVVMLFLWPGSMARLHANLGAVAQTRSELSVYHWPEWPIQDELRRKEVVDLSTAINYYDNALALDPLNNTALRRLGQIAISVGNYEAAQSYLEAAYEISPQQRATRQMLGEIYAINGEIDKATRLWQTIDASQGQLDARVWWHTHIGADQQAEFIEQAIRQLGETN